MLMFNKIKIEMFDHIVIYDIANMSHSFSTWLIIIFKIDFCDHECVKDEWIDDKIKN